MGIAGSRVLECKYGVFMDFISRVLGNLLKTYSVAVEILLGRKGIMGFVKSWSLYWNQRLECMFSFSLC